MSFKQNQLQPFSLAGSGAVIGATSVVLKSMLDIDGNTLTMAGSFGAIGYGTIDPGNNTLEEQISFTGLTNNSNGTTSLTGVSSVTFGSPYTSTSGLLKTHAGSAPFVISNTSGFYSQYPAKQNDETITGQWTFSVFPVTPSNSDASTTVKGVTKMSVAPASATNPIAVGDNDTRVPSADPTTLFAPISVVFNPIASDYSDGSVIETTRSLSRDEYYNALTVPAGVTLTTAGYRIFAKSVTVASTGVITNSGGNGGAGATGAGSGGTAGTAQGAGTLPAGRAGQIGGAGAGGGSNAGVDGTNSTFNIVNAAGSAGGAGGAGASGAGGAAGAAGTNTSTINAPRNAVNAFFLFDFTSATAVARYNVNSGASSGGGAAGNGSGGQGGAGGGSGAAGGIVWICAETITNAGTISSNGGNGGNGGDSNGIGNSGGGGGGAGGNGGAVILLYSTLTNTGSITANAGSGSTGGAKSGTGVAGSTGAAGTAGIVIQITK